MKMLKARLYELEMDKKRKEMEQFYGDKGEIAWGTRSDRMCLQPYQMVKDHRTDAETGRSIPCSTAICRCSWMPICGRGTQRNEMSILAQILADKREEVGLCKARTPASVLDGMAADRPPPPAFVAALRSRPMGLIAEVKRRSPSAGAIREPFGPAGHCPGL
jgi:hypothetical protein